MSDFGKAGNACEQCGHDSGPHAVIATRNDPQLGGVIVCQEKGCECLGTWDVPPFSKREDVRIPDEQELVELRAMFQAGPESAMDNRWHGAIEIRNAPEGVYPPERLVDTLLAKSCPDCKPNLLLTWMPPDSDLSPAMSIDVHHQLWHNTVVHDESCPWLRQHEQEAGA